MKKYVKFENEKILIVNKKYKLSRFYRPGDILLEVKKAFEKMQIDAYKQGVLLLIVSGFTPPLKYGPTGVAKIRNWYSTAGFTPITGLEPNIYGLK